MGGAAIRPADTKT